MGFFRLTACHRCRRLTHPILAASAPTIMHTTRKIFAEEKKQKTFGLLSRTYPAMYAKSQKFFGSFFQKRTFFLPLFLGAALSAAAQQPPARPPVDAPALAALGPFGVGLATQTMGEATRKLTVNVWYPTHPSAAPAVTYHSALVGEDGKPTKFAITGIAVPNAPAAPGRFPLVILAHGFNNTPEVLAWLAENLASKGYVAAAPAFRDPPKFDAPSALFAFAHRPIDVATIAAEAQARAAAGTAPFDHADPDRTALIGYSMGGYGVVTDAGATLDPALAKATNGLMAPYVAGGPLAGKMKVAHLKAVVAISPASSFGPLAMFAPHALAGITAPTFFIVGTQDHVVGYDPGVRTLFESEINAPRYLLAFREAGHNIALSAAPASMRGTLWNQDWFEDPVWCKTRLIGIEAHFITAFLDRYVKGDATKAAYLDGLVPNSDDGVWAKPPAYGAVSPGAPAATLWKGFQVSHAAGMVLEFRAPKK
jgi:predicted dienelactone hydrolase